MKKRIEKILFVLVLLWTIGFVGQEHLYGQPYIFYTKVVSDRGDADLYRWNLRNDQKELFLSAGDGQRIVGLAWNDPQTKLFMQNRASIEVLDLDGNNQRNELIQGVSVLRQALDAVQRNKFFVFYENADSIISAVYDRSVYTELQRLNDFFNFDPPWLSSDQTKIYASISDSSRIKFRAVDVATYQTVWEHQLGALGPFRFVPLQDDTKNGKALMSYEYSSGYGDLHYVVCDPEASSTATPILFPWRSKGYLSADARYAILERVDSDTTQPDAEYKPGEVTVFDAASGSMVRQLTLPPEGQIYLFQTQPDTLYYIAPDSVIHKYSLSGGSVPIQLGSFHASIYLNTNVLLEWMTISETNNYGFEVQRSANSPSNFQTIPGSFIPGHGTTLEPHYYSYINYNPGIGNWYYRLKQIDLDGTTHYTDPVYVVIAGTPIDVELESFAATITGGGNVKLDWATTRERNNNRFEVLVSENDSLHFQAIPNGRVAGNGNSQTRKTYNFRDKRSRPGVWFYRLKQYDMQMNTRQSYAIRAQVQ